MSVRATAEAQPEFPLPADQIGEGIVLAVMKHTTNVRRLDLWPFRSTDRKLNRHDEK